MNNKEFLHAIPFALAAALEEWQQHTDLSDFLLELVPIPTNDQPQGFVHATIRKLKSLF